jgi:hypothetical protein
MQFIAKRPFVPFKMVSHTLVSKGGLESKRHASSLSEHLDSSGLTSDFVDSPGARVHPASEPSGARVYS